jgi:hypothetical protein
MKVILSKQEFRQISTMNFFVAKYIDFLHTILITTEYNDKNLISYEYIVRLYCVCRTYEIAKNKQDNATPLPLCVSSLLMMIYSERPRIC